MVFAPRHPLEVSMASTSPSCRKSYLYLWNTYVPLQRVQEQLKIFDRSIHDGNRYWWTGRFACSVVEELYSDAPQIVWNMVEFLLLPSLVCRSGPLALGGRGKNSSHDGDLEFDSDEVIERLLIVGRINTIWNLLVAISILIL